MEEADREKHDCSYILVVVLLYAIAKHAAEDETLSHSSFFCHEELKERERIYSACALTNREGEMTSDSEGGRANKRQR